MSSYIPTDDTDESGVDNVAPAENGPGQDAASFSADAQRARFRDSVSGSSDSSTNSPNLPGGPYNPRPMTIEGKTYDPFNPPKLYRNSDGTTEFRGGKVVIESQGTQSKKDGEANNEKMEYKEIDERIKIAGAYLARLDKYAESVKVDPDTGAIEYTKPELDEITDPQALEYQQTFTQLLGRFKEPNTKALQILQNSQGVLDVKNIMGALVVTYDSSKATPDIPQLFPSDTFPNAEDSKRGLHEAATAEYLGLAIVDINQAKRSDGTSPTVSAIHEIQHHTRSMSDYLITQDPQLDMQSAFVSGRNVALFGGGKDRITTGQSYVHDAKTYSALLSREFTYADDYPNITRQQQYLDELHSSYLQKKPNWFHADGNVYAGNNHGKHSELVGSNSTDIDATKQMLGYLQGFYSVDLIHKAWQGKLTSNPDSLGPSQKQLLAEFPDIYRDAGALIGAARTVQQAERLVAGKWEELKSRYPRLLTEQVFTNLLNNWESGQNGQKGAGVDNLRKILLGN
ncbi:MAG TPA: hypothetical protein VM077_01185 [Candidatus Limnocylindrales bacterium]|nr:hypothetical protein [Candidatus Limnocylindrales bacterium]